MEQQAHTLSVKDLLKDVKLKGEGVVNHTDKSEAQFSIKKEPEHYHKVQRLFHCSGDVQVKAGAS